MLVYNHSHLSVCPCSSISHKYVLAFKTKWGTGSLILIERRNCWRVDNLTNWGAVYQTQTQASTPKGPSAATRMHSVWMRYRAWCKQSWPSSHFPAGCSTYHALCMVVDNVIIYFFLSFSAYHIISEIRVEDYLITTSGIDTILGSGK